MKPVSLRQKRNVPSVILLLSTFFAAQTIFLPTSYSFSPPAGAPANSEISTTPCFFSIPNLEIKSVGELYVLNNPDDPTFLEVVEKLPGGGFGRLLRYRGWDERGERIDLEFVYQDRENRITILDYRSGKFFRVTFSTPPADPFSVLPLKEEGLNTKLVATQVPAVKFLISEVGLFGLITPQVERLDSLSRVFLKENIWANRHLRGPPEGGLRL